MLDANSRFCLQRFSKDIASLMGPDARLLVQDDVIDKKAIKLIERFDLPCWQNIGVDPAVVVKLLLEEAHIEQDVNAFLNPADKVRLQDKVRYVLWGERIPCFSAHDAHELNQRLSRCESGSPMSQNIERWLPVIAECMNQGDVPRAWARANLAYVSCRNNRLADIATIRNSKQAVEIKLVLLSVYFYDEDVNVRRQALAAVTAVANLNWGDVGDWFDRDRDGYLSDEDDPLELFKSSEEERLSHFVGFVKGLVHLLDDADVDVRKGSLNALYSLIAELSVISPLVAQTPELFMALTRLCADEEILGLESDEGDEQMYIRVVLEQLVEDKNNTQLLTQIDEWVEGLVRSLADPDEDVRIKVLPALAMLSAPKDMREFWVMRKEGLFVGLARCLTDANVLVRQISLCILSNLSSDEDDRQLMVQTPGLRQSLASLARDGDATVRRSANRVLNDLNTVPNH